MVDDKVCAYMFSYSDSFSRYGPEYMLTKLLEKYDTLVLQISVPFPYDRYVNEYKIVRNGLCYQQYSKCKCNEVSKMLKEFIRFGVIFS